jgi:hypothetical protein
MSEGTDQKYTWVAGLLLLLIVVAFKASTIDQIPICDTAMGMFPAASFLAESGWDYASLLEMRGWYHAEPNVHTTSPITFLTSIAYWAFEDPTWTFRALHLFHFTLTALILFEVFRIVRPRFGWAVALLAALVVFFIPVFRVQVGYMYLEIPLALATLLALRTWCDGRLGWAVFWATLAYLIKDTGVIVVATLFGAALMEKRPVGQRLWRTAAVVLPTAIIVAVRFGLIFPPRAGTPFEHGYVGYLARLLTSVSTAPHLMILLGCFAALALMHLREHLSTLREPVAPDDSARWQRIVALSVALVGAMFSFLLTVPIVGYEVFVLPRYYVQIAAPLVLVIADGLMRVGDDLVESDDVASSETVLELGGLQITRGLAPLWVGLVVLLLLFAFSYHGRVLGLAKVTFDNNDFSRVESNARYKSLHEVQKRGIKLLMERADDTPAFYCRTAAYMLRYPSMGYGEPIRNGHFFYAESPYYDAPIAEFPDHFLMLYTVRGHGCEGMPRVYQEAKKDPAYRVEMEVLEEDGYEVRLIEIRRIEGDTNESAAE